MTEKIPLSKGRKPAQGEKRQFLTTIDPEVIRQVKQAAIALDRTASQIVEEAARDWLELHRAGRR